MQLMLIASNILLLRNRGVAEFTEMMTQKGEGCIFETKLDRHKRTDG